MCLIICVYNIILNSYMMIVNWAVPVLLVCCGRHYDTFVLNLNIDIIVILVNMESNYSFH